MRITAFILSAVAVPALLLGDTLTLRNGTVFDGTFLNGNGHEIVFRDFAGIQHRIGRDQIQTLSFGYYGEANRVSEGFLETIPSGTTIMVRPTGRIDSMQPGQIFPGVIDQDILDVNGNVLIPTGSNCNLVVRTITPDNEYNPPVLALDLQSVRVNGTQYFVTTSDLTRNSSGTVLGNLVGGLLGQNVVTHGTKIMAPANTDLTFQLNAPLQLQMNVP